MPTTSEVNGLDRTADVDRDTTFLWMLRDCTRHDHKFYAARAVHLDGAAACNLPIRVEQLP